MAKPGNGEGGEGRKMDEAYHEVFKWLSGSVATAIPKPSQRRALPSD
ncbi:hypothetical protein OAF43_01090 [bacterium]|nr:hypothetical protein [bacterium]